MTHCITSDTCNVSFFSLSRRNPRHYAFVQIKGYGKIMFLKSNCITIQFFEKNFCFILHVDKSQFVC